MEIKIVEGVCDNLMIKPTDEKEFDEIRLILDKVCKYSWIYDDDSKDFNIAIGVMRKDV